MRILLSTIGSRGDVQPLVGLARELKSLGHQARLCVPPDFREWIERFALPVTTIGPELRSTAKPAAPGPALTPERRLQLIEATVSTQFDTILSAAKGCDMIVGATALQVAAPSVAEFLRIPYVFVAYCPAVLPSSSHAPPVLPMPDPGPPAPATTYAELWAKDARRWNDSWATPINGRRASLGLCAIDDVRSHVLTDQPWLAADPVLAPRRDSPGTRVIQTGAWILPDDDAIGRELEAFLDAGAPPLYIGFGSGRAPEQITRQLLVTIRSLGLRAIVSSGWADLTGANGAPDRLVIGEVNHQALFKRVAAVVHHGGAGTTTAAARAGVPQVVIPQMYDQFYWAQRVAELGVGVSLAAAAPAVRSVESALERVLEPGVLSRARSLASEVSIDGARKAARRLVAMFEVRE